MTLNIKDTNAQRHFTRFPDSQAMGIGAEAVLPLGSRKSDRITIEQPLYGRD
jgi:hypothetical protein